MHEARTAGLNDAVVGITGFVFGFIRTEGSVLFHGFEYTGNPFVPLKASVERKGKVLLALNALNFLCFYNGDMSIGGIGSYPGVVYGGALFEDFLSNALFACDIVKEADQLFWAKQRGKVAIDDDTVPGPIEELDFLGKER